MDKKLTLSLNQKIIEQAKKYAKSNSTSLSKLIENYLGTLTSKTKQEEIEITPLVESLSGIINLPADFDLKKSKREYLKKKYK